MQIARAYDEMFMEYALSLATQGWGRTGINPLVGAVVVKNGKIIGKGFHRKIGEAHAEVVALTEAGAGARDADLYVNLEPCCVHGYTPPCVNAIIASNVRRVIVGAIDPNPAVNGKGIAILREHGIEVIEDVLVARARELNRWYNKYIVGKIPYVILKCATSKDMKISGFSKKYITSEDSLRYVHALRSKVGAILVGINTVLKDDPYLTDRLIKRHSPARIVIDPDLKIPDHVNFLTPNTRRVIITHHDSKPSRHAALQERGVELIQMEGERFNAQDLLVQIGKLKIGSILVEGGAITMNTFLESGHYDELYLFVAPVIVEKGIEMHLDKAILSRNPPEKIGKDLLYHVYRNN